MKRCSGLSGVVPLLCAVLLSGCIGISRQAFDPRNHGNIRSIGIASLEYDHRISIRRYNPIYILMGSTGLVIQNLAMEEKSSRYMRHLHGFTERCVQTALHDLRTALGKQGYVVHMLGMGYWEVMKRAHAHQLPGIDTVLRLRIESLGFRSGGISSPYRPSIIMTARLVEPSTRDVLYADKLAIGYKHASRRMTVLDLGQQAYSYDPLDELIAHAGENALGILMATRTAVRRITADLKRPPEISPFLASEEERTLH